VRIVAIETATGATSVALGDGRIVAASAGRSDRRGHVGFLVPALDFCFAQAGWRPQEIDVVAVDIGPGLFGGIRVGLATAQALAGAAGVPLAPVCSLDAIAFQAATAHRRIWAVVDARRGEVAVAPYHPVPGGVVRDGEWKLIEWYEDGQIELFNLRNDLEEKHNLATANPTQAKALQAKLALWREKLGAAMPTPNPRYDPNATLLNPAQPNPKDKP